MNFELNEEQVLLKDLVENFAGDRYGDLSRRLGYQKGQSGFSEENWALLAELGLLALPFAEEHGGIGGGTIETITVMEAMGAALVVEPMLASVLIAGKLLERGGSPAQRAAWLPEIVAGTKRLALAHAEHAARYNTAFVATTARAIGDDRVELSGDKTLVLAGAGADAFIVSGRTAGNVRDPDGISLYLVAADAPGVERRDYRLTDGSIACELRLRGAPGTPLAAGYAALADTLDEARIAIAAELVGLMTSLFYQTIEYLKTRKQFGVTLGSFQALQHRMADGYARLEQSRSQLYRAALEPAGPGRTKAIAGAKSLISANAVAVGEEAIQMHGGMGVTEELAVGHGHKRIMLLASLFGDSDTELGRYLAA